MFITESKEGENSHLNNFLHSPVVKDPSVLGPDGDNPLSTSCKITNEQFEMVDEVIPPASNNVESLHISINTKSEQNSEIELGTFTSDCKIEIKSRAGSSYTIFEETHNLETSNNIEIREGTGEKGIKVQVNSKYESHSNKIPNRHMLTQILEENVSEAPFDLEHYTATVGLFMKGDVTINDFANANKPVCRAKKLVSNVASVLHTMEKEMSWDEKEEYEGNFDFINQENEDGTFSLVAKAKTNSPSDNKNIRENKGHVYPLDLWFLLSKYIRPEDISVFAAICRNSYEVVQTVAFWRGLYDRYCRNAKNLPKVYQPENMNRIFGLKPTVIRALYCVYPPFLSRLLYLNGIAKHDPNILKHKQCILQWYEKKKKDWFYFFKLKDFTNMPQRHETYNQLNLIKVLGDISANPDDNCTVLQVKSTNFVAIPIVLGLTLTSVSQPLSKGYRHHSLHLGFGSAVRSTNHNFQAESTCVIDPVIDLKVLNWWHPLYPKSGKIEIIPYEEE